MDQGYADSIENLKSMAEVWIHYVDYESRQNQLVPFISRILKEHKCKRVLDAAAGIGFEAACLYHEGYEVVANELNPFLRERMKGFLKNKKAEVKVTGFNWLEFDKRFEKESFDAVLCLGNSLTYLLNKEAQEKAVRNFYTLLKKEGVLVIDERNYELLKKNPDVSLINRKSCYYNSSVRVKINFLREDSLITSIGDKPSYKERYYAFKKGELLKLLKNTGFSEVEQYSDLKKGFDPNAVFYQYVCVK